jgi:HemY protein
VRARHDPAWTADGYVSDRWRPVSPVTGRLDAFQWQTPVASLPSDKSSVIAPSSFEDAMLSPPAPRAIAEGLAEPPREAAPPPETVIEPERKVEAQPDPTPQMVEAVSEPEPMPPLQDNLPTPRAPIEPDLPATPPASAPPQPVAVEVPPPAEPVAPAAPVAQPPESAGPAPLFRPRTDLDRPAPPVPAIVPIVRAPDDPGIEDDELPRDEFAEQLAPTSQAGGWRGFWSRFGG